MPPTGARLPGQGAGPRVREGVQTDKPSPDMPGNLSPRWTLDDAYGLDRVISL